MQLNKETDKPRRSRSWLLCSRAQKVYLFWQTCRNLYINRRRIQ